MKTRRTFTKEFKESVLQELKLRNAAEICREHNINKALVDRWKREYETNPTDAFAGRGKVWKEDAKIAQYERLIGRLYAEIEFLKNLHAKMLEKQAEEKRRRSIE